MTIPQYGRDHHESGLGLSLPDWNSLPEAARVRACQLPEFYGVEEWNSGQCALDIWNAIRELTPPETFPLFRAAAPAEPVGVPRARRAKCLTCYERGWITQNGYRTCSECGGTGDATKAALSPPAADASGVASPNRTVGWLIEREFIDSDRGPFWYTEDAKGRHSWTRDAQKAKRWPSLGAVEASDQYRPISSNPEISATEHIFIGEPSPGAPDDLVAHAYIRRGLSVPWRCDVTGNPFGTDTWIIGQPCQCQGCRAATRIATAETTIEGLRADLAALHRAIIGGEPDPCLKTGNFIEMVRATEAARLGAIERATATEAQLAGVEGALRKAAALIEESAEFFSDGDFDLIMAEIEAALTAPAEPEMGGRT